MTTFDIIKRRLLVVGANGMLGQRVIEFYSPLNDVEILASSIEDKPLLDHIQYIKSDITVRNDIKKVVYDFCPDFIINAAAFTNEDLS